MQAIVTQENATYALQEIARPPKPGPGQILVKVVAAAGNISDEYALQNVRKPGLVVGADYAGIVEEVGEDVEGRNVGDRVAGFVANMSSTYAGTYAEYCLADAYTSVTIPSNITFEQATTIGLSGFTAAQTLFQVRPGIPLTEDQYVLIWGAATVLGMWTVQLARRKGYRVVATASTSNHTLLKELGAEEVFDYSARDVSDRIKRYTNGNLTFAVDCISDPSKGTPSAVAETFGERGGFISAVLKFDKKDLGRREDVEFKMVLVYTLLGKDVHNPFFIPASKEHYEDGRKYAKMLEEGLANGSLKIPPIKIVEGGLKGVKAGWEQLLAGNVRAQKLVYRIADTFRS